MRLHCRYVCMNRAKYTNTYTVAPLLFGENDSVTLSLTFPFYTLLSVFSYLFLFFLSCFAMPIIRGNSRAAANSSKGNPSNIPGRAIFFFSGFLLGALFMVFAPSLYNAAETSSLHRFMNHIRRNTLSARASSDILKLGNPGIYKFKKR